jgi:murein DD-endopeptidase MepM/ murein hydrolase activator NlpD
MKKREKKYSTILIVDKTQGTPKALSVRSGHLDRWYWYLISMIIFVTILVISLFFYAKQAAKNQEAAIKLEKFQREILKPLAIDTNVAKKYIENIDKKLKKIDTYLEQRGVNSPIKHEKASTAQVANQQAIQTYILYDKYLSDVLKRLKETPIGYPFYSVINSEFGYRKDPFGRRRSVFHSGLDIKGEKGDPVNASAYGTVESAGWNSGYGNCVIIKHKNGYKTLYGHLSKIVVKEKQSVKAGQKIGEIGSTGHSTGNHLHYEVHKNGKAINPRNFLKLE